MSAVQPVSPEQAFVNLAGIAADLKAERDAALALLRKLSVAGRECVAYAEDVSPDRISDVCNCAVCRLAAIVVEADTFLETIPDARS